LHGLAEGFLRLVRQLWQRFKRQRAGDFELDERVDFRLLFDAGDVPLKAAIETVSPRGLGPRKSTAFAKPIGKA
jgi:hypothetical protein